MEDSCVFSNKMKKMFKSLKKKGGRLLRTNNSTSTSNLNNISDPSQSEEQNQQSSVVQQETCSSELVVVVPDKRLELQVVNSLPLRSCSVEKVNLNPSVQVESDCCTSVVAVQNSSHYISSSDEEGAASNTEMALCLYEQPPTELVQFHDVPVDQLDLIRNEALQEANREYPIKCYDFCLVCCEEDYLIAENLKERLCSSFNLVGCMIENDSFMLGRDIFQAYEFMMDRSTKVMFLITDAFNRDPFNQRLQNGAVFQTLVSRVKKEKCVPVFPNGLREVPLPLSGISGISFKLPAEVLDARVNSTYTEEMRRIRVMKEQVLLEMRDKFYNEVLARRAEEQRARLVQQQQSRALSAATRNGENMMAITSGTSQPGEAGTLQGVKPIPGLDGILADAGLGGEQKSSLLNVLSGVANPGPGSISVSGSEQVRIGNDVSIVVYVTQNGATEVTVNDSEQQRRVSISSNSSQSSSSDSDTD